MDDPALLRRYLTERSEASFAEIVRRHLNVVYFTAVRHLPGEAGHLAEDVAQAVFAQLAAKAPALASRPSITGWLYLATRYEARHAARAEQRRKSRETEAQRMHDQLNTSGPEWESLRPVIDDALCSLNERERELILWRFLEGNAFGEIGARLGLSPDAARFRVDRALDKLRLRLGKKGINSTVALLSVALATQVGAAAPTGLASSIAASSFVTTANSAPAWIGVLQFMSTAKTLTGLAVMVGLLGAGLAIRQEQSAGVMRQEVAKLISENEQLRSRRQELESRARIVQRDVSLAQDEYRQRVADQEKTAQAEAEAKGRSAVVAPRPPAPPVINRELSANPEVRKNLGEWIAGNQAVSLGGLDVELGLSPEKSEALEALLSQAPINMGVWISLLPEGATMQDMRAKVQEFLGQSDFQKLQAYERTGFVRRVANGLAGNLYDTATPLSAAQANALTTMLAETSPQYRHGIPPFPSAIDWNAALYGAARILSPPQLAVFKEATLLLSTQPDIWSSLHTIHPGNLGGSIQPPPSILAPPPPPKS